MSEITSVAVVVVGRVQGVTYRAWTRREAEARGLSGHVSNRADGAVEAAFTGPADAVEAMVQACWAGTPGARVERVEVTAGEPSAGASGFAIRQ